MRSRYPALSLFLSVALAPTAWTVPAFADELDDQARAIEQRPEDAKSYEDYGTAAIKKGRFDDAIAKLKVGIARVSDFPRGYYLLAYAYRKKEAWSDAADYYRVYIALKPQETDPYFGLGAALAGLGDKKGAATAYRKYVSLEKKPTSQRFVDLANSEIAKLDPPPPPPPPPTPPPSYGSASTSTSTAAPSGGDASGLKAEAESLRGQKRFDEAAAVYRRAIDAAPNDVELYRALGDCYFSVKRFNEAAQAFRDATTRDPSLAIGWYNLAHALRKAARNGEAVEAYRRYMKLKPDDPDPYYGLGQTLKALGDATGAISSFRKYIETEHRPEEQKWVEKARVELAALEAEQRKAPGGEAGKVGADDKSTLDLGNSGAQPGMGGASPSPLEALPHDDTDLLTPSDFSAPRLPTDLHDPFSPKSPYLNSDHDMGGLMNPFPPATAPSLSDAGVSHLRRYSEAVAAYREALAAHAQDVAFRYERGIASVMAGHPHDAMATWDRISVDESDIARARRGLERVRTTH